MESTCGGSGNNESKIPESETTGNGKGTESKNEDTDKHKKCKLEEGDQGDNSECPELDNKKEIEAPLTPTTSQTQTTYADADSQKEPESYNDNHKNQGATGGATAHGIETDKVYGGTTDQETTKPQV